MENGICHLPLLRIFETDHFGKGLDGRKPMIAGFGQIFALVLKVFKESND
jgi:hypothetical protein